MKIMKFGGERLITGAKSLQYLSAISGKRIFIVLGGRSLFQNGSISKLEAILKEAGKTYELFSGVQKNPDTKIIIKGVEAMKLFKPDTVLAIGGGSPIDAAKLMALFYEYPELNFETILEKPLPEERKEVAFIAVPTTSGTGTEVTKSAVVTFVEKNIKIGLRTEAFIPDIAILDATLTLTMPDSVVAETGIDAMTHAVECYINKNIDDYSECLAKGAVYGLYKYLPISYKEKTLESREKVHNYQSAAGMAFANVGLGMAHGIAHAFGGKYDLGHGLINGVVLPYVLEFNRRDLLVKEKLNLLAKSIGESDFVEGILKLEKGINIPKSFEELGLDLSLFEKDLKMLVDNSLKGSTISNPVPITEKQMESLLKCIFSGDLDSVKNIE